MAAMQPTTPQMKQADLKVASSDKKQSNKDLQKTRLCVYNLQGKCGYGSNCSFAHSTTEVKTVPDLRKTQLCEKFAAGQCFNKDCSYAHGEAELREPPNFKKKLCKWHVKGACRNGVKCGFAHDLKDLRVEAPPGFEPIGTQAHKPKKTEKVAPPPGLTKISAENDCDASTDAPSSQAEFDLGVPEAPSMPEEHLFRFMAGRGSAPLQQQVALMTSAIGGLQAKLSQLEDMMLQNQVTAMQQQIEQLTQQCWALESGLGAEQQSKSRLNPKAAPFKPVDAKSDDSTGDGSE